MMVVVNRNPWHEGLTRNMAPTTMHEQLVRIRARTVGLGVGVGPHEGGHLRRSRATRGTVAATATQGEDEQHNRDRDAKCDKPRDNHLERAGVHDQVSI